MCSSCSVCSCVLYLVQYVCSLCSSSLCSLYVPHACSSVFLMFSVCVCSGVMYSSCSVFFTLCPSVSCVLHCSCSVFCSALCSVLSLIVFCLSLCSVGSSFLVLVCLITKNMHEEHTEYKEHREYKNLRYIITRREKMKAHNTQKNRNTTRRTLNKRNMECYWQVKLLMSG